MAKRYTKDELIAFINRADDFDKLATARDFIDKLSYLSDDDREELHNECLMRGDLLEQRMFGLEYDSGWEKDYGPSNPWDAPGMKVSDFITGVCYF